MKRIACLWIVILLTPHIPKCWGSEESFSDWFARLSKELDDQAEQVGLDISYEENWRKYYAPFYDGDTSFWQTLPPYGPSRFNPHAREFVPDQVDQETSP